MSSAANSNNRNDLPSTVFVKLDRDNYPLWKSMVLPIIRGARLDGYMLGKKECPEEFITAADSSKKISNPDKNYSRPNYSTGHDKQESYDAFLASHNSVQDYDWYFDSGASNHVTHQTDKFQDLTEHHGQVDSEGNSIGEASIPNIEEENPAEINSEDSQDANSDTEQTDNGSSDNDITHEEIPNIVQQQSVGESSLNTSNAIHTRSKSGIHKPKLPYIGLTENYKDTMEPVNAKEALTRPLWKEAMQKEFEALMSNKTWVLVPYQDQENIVDSK
ncbi:hypothetical protein QL285_019095 [Trifolium repens]|nr:hypothetical protein QL285_019095 [Trifolium repens]